MKWSTRTEDFPRTQINDPEGNPKYGEISNVYTKVTYSQSGTVIMEHGNQLGFCRRSLDSALSGYTVVKKLSLMRTNKVSW